MPSVSDFPLSPCTLEEASALLAAASAEGRSLRIGRDVLTNELNRVLEHEAGDLTCTVEAGVRLSQLRARLAQHGQRLSLDPPGDPTVGACLAANLSGPLRHRFGAPRDLVLGVTLVLADGTVANAGGKVVKNVAGYDLGKLVCGSRGTLALIVRVSMRLHPLPAAARTVVVETDRVGAAVAALVHSQLQPSALDVLHPGRVAVLFEGSAGSVEHQVTRAKTLLGGDEVGPRVWDEVRERQGAALGRLRFDPGLLEHALGGVDEAIVRPAAGVAYVPTEVESDLPAAVRALNERIRARFDPTSVFAA